MWPCPPPVCCTSLLYFTTVHYYCTQLLNFTSITCAMRCSTDVALSATLLLSPSLRSRNSKCASTCHCRHIKSYTYARYAAGPMDLYTYIHAVKCGHVRVTSTHIYTVTCRHMYSARQCAARQSAQTCGICQICGMYDRCSILLMCNTTHSDV